MTQDERDDAELARLLAEQRGHVDAMTPLAEAQWLLKATSEVGRSGPVGLG